MTSFRVFAIAAGWFLVGGAGIASFGAEKDKPSGQPVEKPVQHTVDAGVDFPTGPTGVDIQAEKRPGGFTIPKGSGGARLKYSFHNPKSGFSSTKLHGSNVFSVTLHRYMTEIDKNPDFVLPPGEYKFVVGGEPGASGTLTYTKVPYTDDTTTVKPPTGTNKKKKKHHDKPTDSNDPTRDPLNPGGEDVLLNLPKDFDVTSPDFYFIGGGSSDYPKFPVVLHFRGPNVTATGEQKLPPDMKGLPSQLGGSLDLSATYRKGHLSGKATYVYWNHAIKQGVDFFRCKCEGKVSGQADANGKLRITITWTGVEWKTRDATSVGTETQFGP
jgi:hypothetical protein